MRALLSRWQSAHFYKYILPEILSLASSVVSVDSTAQWPFPFVAPFSSGADPFSSLGAASSAFGVSSFFSTTSLTGTSLVTSWIGVSSSTLHDLQKICFSHSEINLKILPSNAMKILSSLLHTKPHLQKKEVALIVDTPSEILIGTVLAASQIHKLLLQNL